MGNPQCHLHFLVAGFPVCCCLADPQHLLNQCLVATRVLPAKPPNFSRHPLRARESSSLSSNPASPLPVPGFYPERIQLPLHLSPFKATRYQLLPSIPLSIPQQHRSKVSQFPRLCRTPAPPSLPSPPFCDEPSMSKRARDETTTSARDLVEIKLVGAEAFPGETSFAPDYVHQIFEDEKVGDVSPELRLECLFNDVTLDVCLRATGAPLRGAAEDALYTLAGALPAAQTEKEFAATLQRPPPDGGALVGPLLGEYTRGGRTFRIHCGALHAAAQAPSFMRGLQALMRFYIETWSDVDEDERWRVVAVFEAAERPRLVAAATIFHFQRWLTHADALPLQRAAGPALVVRLCQAIVMPQFRSQGHGAHLLQAVYTHAHAEGAIELTVEDPNPRFRMVRDVVDYRNCHALGLLPPDSLAAAAPLEAIGEARRKLLLTHEQATRCHELRQYVQLAGELAVVDEADSEAREAVVKPWRLKVKRRLSRQHQEELDPTVLAAEAEAAGETLSAAELVERRKARLEELYEETVGEYRLLSHRLGVAAHKKA